MIVNIRGTSGSGKTHLVRQLMRAMGPSLQPVLNAQHKVEGYRGSLVWPGLYHERQPRKSDGSRDPDKVIKTQYCTPVSFVGKYETACGGCDTIKTQDEIKERVRRFALTGSVVFEGLLISVLYQGYAELADYFLSASRTSVPSMEKALGREVDTFPPFVFAFLDTPLELCLERVKSRRVAVGNSKPLDETNTRAKWDTCHKLVDKFKTANYPVVVLDHTDALEQMKIILKGAL